MTTIEQVKQLREETGISISECRKALEEAEGNLERAKEILRKRDGDWSGKKSGRTTNAGIIESYIHSNSKVGVLLDLRCETDFVAFNEEFKKLAHELCLQIAATNPQFVKPEDIPDDVLKKEEEIYREQFSGSGKAPGIIKKIVEGRLEQYKKENSLLTQISIREQNKTVKEIIEESIGRLGENIVVHRFIRYEI